MDQIDTNKLAGKEIYNYNNNSTTDIHDTKTKMNRLVKEKCILRKPNLKNKKRESTETIIPLNTRAQGNSQMIFLTNHGTKSKSLHGAMTSLTMSNSAGTDTKTKEKMNK